MKKDIPTLESDLRVDRVAKARAEQELKDRKVRYGCLKGSFAQDMIEESKRRLARIEARVRQTQEELKARRGPSLPA